MQSRSEEADGPLVLVMCAGKEAVEVAHDMGSRYGRAAGVRIAAAVTPMGTQPPPVCKGVPNNAVLRYV